MFDSMILLESTLTLLFSRELERDGTRCDITFILLQPMSSRNRGKFAPPTKTKNPEDGYTFDDFHRDLSQGVL